MYRAFKKKDLCCLVTEREVLKIRSSSFCSKARERREVLKPWHHSHSASELGFLFCNALGTFREWEERLLHISPVGTCKTRQRKHTYYRPRSLHIWNMVMRCWNRYWQSGGQAQRQTFWHVGSGLVGLDSFCAWLVTDTDQTEKNPHCVYAVRVQVLHVYFSSQDNK